MKRLSIDDNFFNKIDTEEKAYFLGLMASDGNVSSSRPMMEISLSGDEDRVILEKFVTALNYAGTIKKKTVKYKNAQPCSRLSFTSQKIKDDLINYGVPPKKSLSLKFNTAIRKDLIRHYVRGYFDGDGSVSYKKDGSFLVSLTSSRPFIKTLKDIIMNNLELDSHIESSTKTKAQNLKLGGNFVSLIFLDWIYRDARIFLPRKERKYQMCKDIVAKKLLKKHQFYNLYSIPKVMYSANKCAIILGIDFDMSEYNGLRSDRKEQDKIIGIYHLGNSLRKTAKIVGLSMNLVRNVLKKNGVKIRSFRKSLV